MAQATLKQICSRAVALYPGNCSGAVKFIAREMGYAVPEVQANGLIDFFDSPQNNWSVVNEMEAQKAADSGRLVIGGKRDQPNGHVVAVVSGGEVPSGGYSFKFPRFTQQMVKDLRDILTEISRANPPPNQALVGKALTLQNELDGVSTAPGQKAVRDAYRFLSKDLAGVGVLLSQPTMTKVRSIVDGLKDVTNFVSYAVPTKGSYPRSCSTSIGHYPWDPWPAWPGAISNGEKSVFDAWGSESNYLGVKYWAAPLQIFDFSKITPGQQLVTRAPISKGRNEWRFPEHCVLSADLAAGTVFLVRGMQTAEKWFDLEAKDFVGLKLRLSSEEGAWLFKG